MDYAFGSGASVPDFLTHSVREKVKDVPKAHKLAVDVPAILGTTRRAACIVLAFPSRKRATVKASRKANRLRIRLGRR